MNPAEEAFRKYFFVIIIAVGVVGGLILFSITQSDSDHPATAPAVQVSGDDAAKCQAAIDSGKTTGFIMRQDGDTIYVSKDWYGLPVDDKRKLAMMFQCSRNGRPIIIKDGYSDKALAVGTSSGAVTIESE